MVKLGKWNNRKQFPAILFYSIMLSISLTALGSILSTQLVFATSSTGVIVPIYCGPYNNDTNIGTCSNGTSSCPTSSFCWQPLVNAKNNHPHVPMFAVINPNNGPPASNDTYVAKGVVALKNAGIVVLGYIDTCAGSTTCNGNQKTVAQVESEVDTYYNDYKTSGLQGILLDDVLNYVTKSSDCTNNEQQCFQTITNYIHNKSLTYSYGNTAGNPITSTWVNSGTFDILNIFENQGGTNIPAISDLQTDTYTTSTSAFDKHNFSFAVYGQCSLPDSNFIGNSSNFVGLLYFTDAAGAVGTTCHSTDNNPYDRIASYLSPLVNYLDKPTTAIMHINALNSSNNNPITGVFVTVTQNNNQVPSGNTPLPYNGTSGVKYTFSPNNYGNCIFNHWQDNNSTIRARTILVNSTDEPFTAVYSCSNSGIVLNNVQTTSGTVLLSPYQMKLSSFNVGTGSNRLLVVGVESNGQTVSSATFGGTALTKVVSSSINQNAEFWYLKNPSGTGDIVVTMGGTASVVVGAYAFSGVDQTTPIPTNTMNHGSGNPTISITTQYSNSWVLDSPSIYGQSTLSNPTCTQQWNTQVSSVTVTGASSSKSTTSPGSVTCGWNSSVGGNGWDDVAIEVKGS